MTKKDPLNVVYVLLCDDVRMEDSGKAIIIGLYTGDEIRLPPNTPAFKAPITFFIYGKFKPEAPVHLKAWLEGPGGKRLTETDFGEMRLPSGTLSAGQIVWRLFPWDSGGLGRFKLHLVQDDRDRVIYEFGVATN